MTTIAGSAFKNVSPLNLCAAPDAAFAARIGVSFAGFAFDNG